MIEKNPRVLRSRVHNYRRVATHVSRAFPTVERGVPSQSYRRPVYSELQFYLQVSASNHYSSVWPRLTTVYLPASLAVCPTPLERQPFRSVVVIRFEFLVSFSKAETIKILLTSTSKVTSIWGTPWGAAGIPESSSSPRSLLSLEQAYEYTGLVVGVGREDFGPHCGNGSVSLDEGRHYTTRGLDAEGMRSSIERE